MNDFDYDVLQKKRIAQGARHRRGGSKSKYCSLPSDHMTKKEKNAMNGPVKTYNINNPMKLKEFKNLPSDLRKTYLAKLVNEFHANDGMIAEMFGCTASNIKAYRSALGIPSLGCGAKSQPSKEQATKWKSFLLAGAIEGGYKYLKETYQPIYNAELTDAWIHEVGDVIRAKNNQTGIEDNPVEVEDNQPVIEDNPPKVEDDHPVIEDNFSADTNRMQFDATTNDVVTYLRRIGYAAEGLMGGKVRVRLLIESVGE